MQLLQSSKLNPFLSFTYPFFIIFFVVVNKWDEIGSPVSCREQNRGGKTLVDVERR